MVIRVVASGLEESKYLSSFQESQEGGSRKLVSLTSISRKVVKPYLEAFSECSKNRMGTGSSQQGFTKVRSSLTNMIPYYSEIT